MQKVKQVFKKMGIIIGGLLLVIIIGTLLFVNLSPEFGGSATKEQREQYEKSNNYKEDAFVNVDEVKMELGFLGFFKSLGSYFKPQPNTLPEKNITVQKIGAVEIVRYEGPTRLIWFGHSAFLLQMDGENILIDPMFGEVPAPNPLLGTKRFSKNLPIEIEELPRIDAVIFSHDHYDHLDYGSVQLLKDKVEMFYTPLGLGVHLTEWGVEKTRIIELDWWEEIDFKTLKFRCTPAQHFSGRGLTDRNKTLWSSWIVQSNKENIFFSGDSGYAPHFKVIGEKYGPFDFAMMECGQYNELWKEIHLMPEETAQAGLDVRAKKIMPIHWGAFKLAMHPWTEPAERVSTKAAELGLPVIFPKIGEPIYLNETDKYREKWWENFN